MKIFFGFCLTVLLGLNIQAGVKITGTSALTLPSNSHLGWAVSLSGDFLAVTAPNESYGETASSGAVYIYKVKEGTWKFFQRIIPDDPSMMKLFGSSVKLSESTLLVGAPNDNGKQGAVYVFTFNNYTWKQTRKITPQNPVLFEMFGTAVDMISDFALVSSVSSNDSELGSGSVYVYKISSGEWTEESKIVSPESNVHDLFGASLAIVSPTQFFAGAPRGYQQEKNCGVVYSFVKSATGWIKSQQISSTNQRESGLFGCAVSYFKTRLLVGAMEESVDTIISGSAYIFELDDSGKWLNVQRLIPKEPVSHDYFGMAVSLTKSVAIIGSPKWEVTQRNSDMGCADVYILNDDRWEFAEKVVPENGENNDHFGLAIASDNNHLVIGARMDDNLAINEGSAHFYKMNDFQTNVTEIENSEKFAIQQIFPNPFSHETTISYILPETVRVKLEVVNIVGEKIIRLIDREENAGNKEVIWNRKNAAGRFVPAGVYICNFEAGSFKQSKQLVVY